MALLLPSAIAQFKESREPIVLICVTESVGFAPDIEILWGSSSMMGSKAHTMELLPRDPSLNLLPRDGIVNYHGPILSPRDAGDYLEALMTTIPWQHDEVIIYGKHIVTA